MATTDKPFGEGWIADYFREVDRLDPDGLMAWYTDDASFRFGNRPPAVGKAAIAAALRQFYATIESMTHRKTGCWVAADSGVWEAEATFRTKDGRTVTLPAVSVLRVRDGKVADFRFVMDAAPLTPDGNGK